LQLPTSITVFECCNSRLCRQFSLTIYLIFLLNFEPDISKIIHYFHLFTHTPPWKSASCTANKEFPNILCNQNVHYNVHNRPPMSHHNQYLPQHCISLWSILILSSHLIIHLGLHNLWVSSFIQVSTSRLYKHSHSLTCMLHSMST
jgi:hypothetical protein